MIPLGFSNVPVLSPPHRPASPRVSIFFLQTFLSSVARDYPTLLPPALPVPESERAMRALVRPWPAPLETSKPNACPSARNSRVRVSAQAAKFTGGIRVIGLKLYSNFTFSGAAAPLIDQRSFLTHPLSGEPIVSVAYQARVALWRLTRRRLSAAEVEMLPVLFVCDVSVCQSPSRQASCGPFH